MNLRSGLFLMCLLASCAGPTQKLVVKQFQLRDQTPLSTDDPMVRMEKERRLRGAVSLAERGQRLGQYYTLVWNDPDGVGQGDVELVFQYQQGATASKIKRLVRSFPASDKGGKVDFEVIGDNYFKGGKVLTWKATLSRGGRELASQQSYLWQ